MKKLIIILPILLIFLSFLAMSSQKSQFSVKNSPKRQLETKTTHQASTQQNQSSTTHKSNDHDDDDDEDDDDDDDKKHDKHTAAATHGQTANHNTTAHGDAHGEGHSGGHHVASETLVVFFLFMTLLLGTFIRILNKYYGLSYTPTLFFLGIITGLGALSLEEGLVKNSIKTICFINPHGLLQIFLPILVFEAGFNLDWHVFRKQIVPILILAFPCVLINAFIMMFSVKGILQYEDEYYTWTGAFMFGSIVSCTDPIAVVALLKELGASKKFNTLIEGESLINDATGMVLYQLGSTIYKGQSGSPLSILWLFITLTVGGVILGVTVGFLASSLIKKLFNDEILVVNTTFICGFIAFFLAESYFAELGIMISGIMTLVSLGSFMAAFGNSRINAEVHHAVHQFWHVLVYCAETIIFFLAGVIVGFKVIGDDAGFIRGIDYWKLVGLYICMSVARAISLVIFYPQLKTKGYGLSKKEFYVLVYGGLRGAVGISFAMIAGGDPDLSPALRDIFLFDMAGCAVLTLIINATTCGALIDKLGILLLPSVKHKQFKQYIENLIDETEEKIFHLKQNKFLQVCDTDQVKKLVGIPKLQEKVTEVEYIYRERNQQEQEYDQIELQEYNQTQQRLIQDDDDEDQKPVQKLDPKQLKALIQVRSKFLSLLKQIYWEQFEKNQCTGDALISLMESANWDQDNTDKPFNSWEIIEHSFYTYNTIRSLLQFKQYPLIGNYVRNLVFNHIAHQYIVASTFVQANEKAQETAKKFLVEEQYLNQVIKECENQKVKGEDYMLLYLGVYFPEIQSQVQTKKAAYEILEHEKDFLKENLEIGSIDMKEYADIRKVIDQQSRKLESYIPDWEPKSAKQLISEIPLFQYITEAQIDKLLQEAREQTFQKNMQFINESEKATSFYVILRGSASEIIQGYKSKKTVGDAISLFQLLSQSKNNITSLTAESDLVVMHFSLKKMQQIVKTNIELETYLWRECLYGFSQIYTKQLRLLQNYSREQIQQIATNSMLRKYRPGEIIDVSKGCVQIEGETKMYNDQEYQKLELGKLISEIEDDEHNESIQAQFQQELSKLQQFKNFENVQFFQPNKFSLLMAVKHTNILHFINDKVLEVLENEMLERYSRYSHYDPSARRRQQQQQQPQFQQHLSPEFSKNDDFDSNYQEPQIKIQQIDEEK